MPQLIIRGIDTEQVCKVNEILVKELAHICDTTEDNFMLEIQHTTAIEGGKVVSSFPFIHIWWFDRGQEVKNQVAACVTKYFRLVGVDELEVAFSEFAENSYYINGDCCGR